MTSPIIETNIELVISEHAPNEVLLIEKRLKVLAAEAAELKHRQFTPHSWTNGIGVLANLHVVAGIGGGPYFEFPFDPPGWTVERRDFFIKPVNVDKHGDVLIPNAPGLGIELDHDAVKRYTI